MRYKGMSKESKLIAGWTEGNVVDCDSDEIMRIINGNSEQGVQGSDEMGMEAWIKWNSSDEQTSWLEEESEGDGRWSEVLWFQTRAAEYDEAEMEHGTQEENYI